MSSFVVAIPHATKLASAVYIVIALLGFITHSVDWLALFAGYIMPPHFYVLSLFTWTCYHDNVVEAILGLVALILVGTHVEPLWTAKEFAKFLVIVSACSGFVTVVIVYILVAVLPSNYGWKDHLLFDSFFYGCSSLLAGFTVIGKQLFAEQQVSIAGNELSTRLKTLPVLIALFHIVAALLGFSPMRLLPTLSGLVVAWIYLRFLQHNPTTGLTGDASDNFAFSSFFPELIRPHVARLLGGRGTTNVSRHVPLLPLTTPATTKPSAAVERRRALATAALDERLRLKLLAGNDAESDSSSPAAETTKPDEK